MKRPFLAAGLLLAILLARPAAARPGTVTWSDGHQQTGDLSLTPGKQLHIFSAASSMEIPLDQARQIRFVPEKEENREGYYFPDAGQATQAKTGQVYPVRYLKTQITLADGQVVDGHLFTTVLYVTSDNGTGKVVLMAKQTGTDNQKLADLAYPTLITFSDAAASYCQLDLSHAAVAPTQPPTVLLLPDLTVIPATQLPASAAGPNSPPSAAPPPPAPGSAVPGEPPVAVFNAGAPPVWTIPASHPTHLIFSVQAADGLHVAWPDTPTPSDVHAALQNGLDDLRDFYDTRTLLASYPDGDDVFTLVRMERKGVSYGMSADQIPWSLVVLRWKYDVDAHKVTLLNRASLAIGRATDKTPVPPVLISSALLGDITAAPATHP